MTGRRSPRKKGRANSDAERRALAKAHGRPADGPLTGGRPREATDRRPGFAQAWVDGGVQQVGSTAAIGYRIVDADGILLAEHGELLGQASPLAAEFAAILAGLRCTRELGVGRLELRSDSRTAVQHLRGERSVRSPALLETAGAIIDAMEQLDGVYVIWIPSDLNEAHALVTAALAHAPRDLGS